MRVVGGRRRCHHPCSLIVLPRKFPGSVDGGSKGGDSEFVCMNKKNVRYSFFVHLFKGFPHLV